MDQFTDKYRTLSTAALLKIIDNPGDYQPGAVEAAQMELASRNVSDEELADANAENEEQETEREARAGKMQDFMDKITNIAGSFFETVNPVQQAPVPLKRLILLLSIVFGILGLAQLYYFAYYVFMLHRYNENIPIRFLTPYLFQGIYITLTALLFWQRGKWGWIFLGIYLCFSGCGSTVVVLIEIWRNQTHPSGNFMPINYATGLFTLLFYGGCIWLLYKPGIREIYSIDKASGIITAAVGIFIGLAVFVLVAVR